MIHSFLALPEKPAIIEVNETISFSSSQPSLTIAWSNVNSSLHYTVYCIDELLTTVSQVINGSDNETILYGFLGNTSYTCCVSTFTQDSMRDSSPTCANITTSSTPKLQCNYNNNNDEIISTETSIQLFTTTVTTTVAKSVETSTIYVTSSSSIHIISSIAISSSTSVSTSPLPSTSNTITITTETNNLGSNSLITSWVGGIVTGAVMGVLCAGLILTMGLICYRRVRSTNKLMSVQRDSFVINE